MDKLSYDWWLDMSNMEFYAWYEDIFTDEELDIIEKLVSDDDLHLGEISGETILTSEIVKLSL